MFPGNSSFQFNAPIVYDGPATRSPSTADRAFPVDKMDKGKSKATGYDTRTSRETDGGWAVNYQEHGFKYTSSPIRYWQCSNGASSNTANSTKGNSATWSKQLPLSRSPVAQYANTST